MQFHSRSFERSVPKAGLEGPDAAAYGRSHEITRVVETRALLYGSYVRVYSRPVLNRGGLWCMRLLGGRFLRGGAKRPLYWLCLIGMGVRNRAPLVALSS